MPTYPASFFVWFASGLIDQYFCLVFNLPLNHHSYPACRTKLDVFRYGPGTDGPITQFLTIIDTQKAKPSKVGQIHSLLEWRSKCAKTWLSQPPRTYIYSQPLTQITHSFTLCSVLWWPLALVLFGPLALVLVQVVLLVLLVIAAAALAFAWTPSAPSGSEIGTWPVQKHGVATTSELKIHIPIHIMISIFNVQAKIKDKRQSLHPMSAWIGIQRAWSSGKCLDNLLKNQVDSTSNCWF